jgi:hypothetical protein
MRSLERQKISSMNIRMMTWETCYADRASVECAYDLGTGGQSTVRNLLVVNENTTATHSSKSSLNVYSASIRSLGFLCAESRMIQTASRSENEVR